MQSVLPPNINDAAFLGGRPLWLWLDENGQRITPQTMRNILEGQQFILSRWGHAPLLVTAEHDATEHVDIMGLRLTGVNYNNIVTPANISQGVWDLYILPNQIAGLIIQVQPAPLGLWMPPAVAGLPPVAAAPPAAPAAAAAAAPAGFHMPPPPPPAAAPNIYAGVKYYENHEIPVLAANAENAIMGTPIVAGTEMVNFRGPDGRWNSELEEPRYYTYDTFRQLPMKPFLGLHFKEHPFTRSPLRPLSVRRYRAAGGKSRKTNKRTRARRHRKSRKN